MRHRLKRHRLNRFTSWRKATLISLAKNLLLQQRIKTTKARAKAAQSLVENLISLAKRDGLTAKRRAFEYLGDHKLVSLLFKEIGPRFKDRGSGFTRIINLSSRRGDGASLVVFELTEIKKEETKKPKESKEHKPGETEQEPPKVKKEEITEIKKTKEKPPISQKPSKRFLSGIRKIFKRERDFL